MFYSLLFVGRFKVGLDLPIMQGSDWRPYFSTSGSRIPRSPTATRFEKAPVIDGVVSPGEWDRAFTTSGLIGTFDHEMQESVTVMSLGFDADKLFFLFRCRRGNFEWKLWKKARQNPPADPDADVVPSPIGRGEILRALRSVFQLRVVAVGATVGHSRANVLDDVAETPAIALKNGNQRVVSRDQFLGAPERIV